MDSFTIKYYYDIIYDNISVSINQSKYLFNFYCQQAIHRIARTHQNPHDMGIPVSLVIIFLLRSKDIFSLQLICRYLNYVP